MIAWSRRKNAKPRECKKVLTAGEVGKKSPSRSPRKNWLQAIKEDLRRMGINVWKD